jgi:hypothetical protein
MYFEQLKKPQRYKKIKIKNFNFTIKLIIWFIYGTSGFRIYHS